MSDVTSPQPGWYGDPENPAGERWWNGSGWSDHKRAATDAGTAVSSPSVVVSAPDTSAADAPAFTFGSPAPDGSEPRPDPYTPPATTAAPYYATPYVASPDVASPYAAAPYGAPAYGSGINGLALAGLIASAAGWLIIPLLAPIAGIVLSAFGLRVARQREAAGNPNTGRGLAMAGLIVGIVIAAFTLLGVIVYVVILGSLMTSSSYYG